MTYAKEKNTGEIYSWGLNNYYQLGKLSKFFLKKYVYSVSNFRPLGLCQETNNWINVVTYISYLNKNSKGNLITLKHYVYSVSNFRPLGLCQECRSQH